MARRFPPLAGETPQQWSARVLAAYEAQNQAADDRRQARETAKAAPTCPYCPEPKRPDRLTCAGHTDLPQRDPTFTRITERQAEPIEDFRPEALLDRLRPIGA